MRTLFIINPNAGHGRAARYWARWSNAPCVTEWLWTDAPGHARQLAMGAVERGFDAIAACGGDGTVHEVLNALMDVPPQSRPALAILAGGTGDDFARAAGTPLDWPTGFAAIEAGCTRQVDLGSATGAFGVRYFGVAAFVGAAAQMASDANQGGKPLGGIAGYLPYLARAARFNAEVTIAGDGFVWDGRALSVQIANAPTGGGGIRVCPPARIDDGLLDVVVIETGSLFQTVRTVLAVARGKHLGLPWIHHWSCRAATLEGAGVMLALDGEIVGALPARLEVLPGVLTVVAPAN
jgi:diacylglycerol kinase (ATP)